MCFGNSGFIGIPLIVSMFPETAGIAAASFSLVEATYYWVIGPLLINNGEKKKGIDWKKTCNTSYNIRYFRTYNSFAGFGFSGNCFVGHND